MISRLLTLALAVAAHLALLLLGCVLVVNAAQMLLPHVFLALGDAVPDSTKLAVSGALSGPYGLFAAANLATVARLIWSMTKVEANKTSKPSTTRGDLADVIQSIVETLVVMGIIWISVHLAALVLHYYGPIIL